MSFSPPNFSTDLSGQTAIVVRGADRHGHFGRDRPPTGDLDQGAIGRWEELDARMKRGFTSNRPNRGPKGVSDRR